MKYLRKVEYASVAGVEIWDEAWTKVGVRLEGIEKTIITGVVRKWIKATSEGQNSRILEGGCGAGRYLVYFGRLGYDIIGVDNSANAVTVAKNFDANLKVARASVLDLPFHSESFDYYLSLGVVEHAIDGPEQGLKEAYRVLKRDGLLFVSVPYMNSLRILYERLGILRSKLSIRQRKPEGDFYQYYFTKKEMTSILVSLGFEVLKDYPLNQELGLLRAIPFVRKKRASDYLVRRLAKAIKLFLPWFSTHMVLLVCRKVNLSVSSP